MSPSPRSAAVVTRMLTLLGAAAGACSCGEDRPSPGEHAPHVTAPGPAEAGDAASSDDGAAGDEDARAEGPALDPGPASGLTVDPAGSIVLAPLAGPRGTAAAGQEEIGFYGTDLGFTALHQGQLRIVFGDSWADALVPVIGPISDDCQGVICLDTSGCPAGGVVLPDGDAVEAYAGVDGSYAERRGPPLVFRLNDFAKVSPIAVYAGGLDGALLEGLALKTPMTVFSNGKAGVEAAVFALFGRGEAVPCGACEQGFACDGTLGMASSNKAPCELGTPGCSQAPGGGICVDTTSPRYTPDDAAGRLRGAVWESRVGNADPDVHERYYTRAWPTHKFTSPAATTVSAYSIDTDGLGAPYVADPLPASASQSGSAKVFVWGRPSFVGVRGAPSNVYLAVAENPSYRADGEVAWEPRFFAGLDAQGAPRFSANETDALALADERGVRDEPLDIVNQLSVRFIPELSKWMMLYGGDLEPALHAGATLGQAADVQRNPGGAIHVRFADQPWGPWSSPAPLLVAGDPDVAVGQYGPGGALHQEGCAPEHACARGEAFWALAFGREQRGYFYGANLIPEWTEERVDRVDVYWNVSTFSPYQVLLMRSTIMRGRPLP